MTVEPSSIELEEFELVQAAPGTALLRVAARAPAATPREPTLLVRDDGQVHRVRPLPAPPDPEGWLRAAYSLRMEVLDRGPVFALELWPGAILELPDPLERGGRVFAYRSAALSPDTEMLIELEAAVIEANQTAVALQSEAEQLAARVREAEDDSRVVRQENARLVAERDRVLEENELLRESAEPESAVLEAADRAWEGIETSLTALRQEIDQDLSRLEQELRAARSEAAAAWRAEREARADAERLRAEAAKDDPGQVIELIRDAAEDRVRSEVETEIRAALGARIDER